MSVSVCVCQLCLSVYPPAFFRNYTSYNRQFFCMLGYLWPWLGPSLAALRYVMYFRNEWIWMKSYLRILGHMEACWYCCSEWLLRHRAQDNAPAASYQLHRVLDERRAPKLDESIMHELSGAEPAMHHCLVIWCFEVTAHHKTSILWHQDISFPANKLNTLSIFLHDAIKLSARKSRRQLHVCLCRRNCCSDRSHDWSRRRLRASLLRIFGISCSFYFLVKWST